MDFDRLIESLSPEPIVQKKKKYETFTITPIGGPDEIVKWRQVQEVKESVYRMRLNEREGRIAEVEASLGQKLASPTVHTTSWAEKYAFAQSERKRLARIEAVATRTWEAPEPIKLSITQRIAGFVKRVWLSANF